MPLIANVPPSKILLASITLLFSTAIVAMGDETNTSPATHAPHTEPSTQTPSTTIVVPADVQAAMKMPDGPDKLTALAAAIAPWAKTRPVDAMTWSDQIPTSRLQHLGLQTATVAWLETDEKATINWGLNHADGIEQHFIFGNYCSKYKQAAAEWILQQPQHNAEEVGVAFEAWCCHPYDLKAAQTASDWLLKQKPSKEDAVGALHFVAAGMAWNSPPYAAAWVMQLPVELPRMEAAQHVANIWSRKIPADIPKIQAWITQLPLSADEKATVSKGIVQK